MPAQDLIALVRDMTPDAPLAPLTAWTDARWSALVVPRKMLRPRLGRRAALKIAARRQSWLEMLLPTGTVLPALAGTRLHRDELPALLGANATALEAEADALAGRVQYQITIRCDLARARTAIRYPLLSGATSDSAWKTCFATLVADRLATLPDVVQTALPTPDDVAVNVAVLLPARAGGALDKVLETIDALWPEGLSIRQIGPSPGVSFASIGLHRVESGDLSAAARVLDVAAGASAGEIRAARQTALRRPDAKVDMIRSAATLLTQAQALPAPGPFPQLHVWAEGQAQNATMRAAVA